MLFHHLAHLLGIQQVRLGVLERARTGAMRQIVEQQSFANGLTGVERHQSHRPAVQSLFDGDGTGHDDREKSARRAFLEKHVVALVGRRRHQLGELMERRIGHSLEKLRLAEAVPNGWGSHRLRKITVEWRCAFGWLVRRSGSMITSLPSPLRVGRAHVRFSP